MSSSAYISSMLCYSVIIALIGSSILSVDAIRCHQCNSHLDEDCIALTLNTPRAPRDDQYLKECDGEYSGIAFCRKTNTFLEVNGEKRIVRGCGWHSERPSMGRQDDCYTADNEGFQQIICTCFSDGCNAAPISMRSNSLSVFGLAAVCTVLVAIFRQNC